MSRSTSPYWNPLAAADQAHHWHWLERLEGQVEELILSEDPATGEITRLTRFLTGAYTTAFGGKAHDFPEEILIVSSRLYDEVFGLWWGLGTTPAGGLESCTAPSAARKAALCSTSGSPNEA